MKKQGKAYKHILDDPEEDRNEEDNWRYQTIEKKTAN